MLLLGLNLLLLGLLLRLLRMLVLVMVLVLVVPPVGAVHVRDRARVVADHAVVVAHVVAAVVLHGDVVGPREVPVEGGAVARLVLDVVLLLVLVLHLT